ncbi:glutathione S- transferase, nitrogen catabolite repression regulator [Neodidymelliopsis sp. IMI 364377]|nr:glutathione S- transferase, nitrogen catabolite repression regulator [Neodidymelliopsis sp. IMI 364377]
MSPNSSLKPIVIYGKHGPNPPKVRMLCEELNLPYDQRETQFSELKKPEFLAINPNGRMPAIYDPNTDLTLWESGAIIEYLVEKYDTEHSLSFPQGSNEAQLARQWLFFQVSGQGPYYGQAVWFTKYHSETVQSAQDRYLAEIKRVTGVLNTHLEKQEKGADGPWLVGGKYSYADLAFVPWQSMLVMFGDKLDVSEFKTVTGWLERLKGRAAIEKVVEEMFGSK